jgi:hypothetical protein
LDVLAFTEAFCPDREAIALKSTVNATKKELYLAVGHFL